jgi:iron-sulfur cluster assembly protein
MASAESKLITLTDRAISKLYDLQETTVDKVLRIAVVGGGCSGLSYKLSWVHQADATDNVITFINLWIAVDAKSALYLKGMELDYTDGLDGEGFKFNNPNAKRACGCGSSFST